MENAYKVTNLCYPRGSVIYARFDKKSDMYYLNMRPLIVVSHQMQMFDSLTVIGCGSRDRPGIEISLFNHRAGKWVGNHQFSIAQPYSIYSVTSNQIVEFHGVVDPWTMKAIDKAMAFHLGLTDEIPPYMEGIYDELLKPTYRMATEENTQLKDPHQFGSYNETTRSFYRIPSVAASDTGKPYTKEPTMNTNDLNVTSDPAPTKTVWVIPAISEDDLNPKNARLGTAELIVPQDAEELTLDKFSASIINTFSVLNEQERIDCITRKMTPGKYGKHKEIKLTASQINQVRKAIEVGYELNNGNYAKKLCNKICHRQSNFKFLTPFEKVCAIMYCTPDELEISEEIYRNVAKGVIKEYQLNFSDKRSWRNFRNFDRLQSIDRKV